MLACRPLADMSSNHYDKNSLPLNVSSITFGNKPARSEVCLCYDVNQDYHVSFKLGLSG